MARRAQRCRWRALPTTNDLNMVPTSTMGRPANTVVHESSDLFSRREARQTIGIFPICHNVGPWSESPSLTRRMPNCSITLRIFLPTFIFRFPPAPPLRGIILRYSVTWSLLQCNLR